MLAKSAFRWMKTRSGLNWLIDKAKERRDRINRDLEKGMRDSITEKAL
jgi:hypothetical protein